MSMRKILLLTNIPAPYRIPTFNCLARHVGHDFHVVFCAPSEPRRRWAFPEQEMEFEWKLLSKDGRRADLLEELKSGVKMLIHLRRSRPSAVICGGYDSMASWAAFFWCKLRRRRFVLWVDSTLRDYRPRGLSRGFRTWSKRLIISRTDGVAVSGMASAEYVKTLGARPERIRVARLSGDPATFARQALKLNAAREKLDRGLPARLILYSGRLVHAKGIVVLLEAFRNISRIMVQAGLLIVGDGPDEAEIKGFCRKANLEHVFFEGPREYQYMPYYYALADVLALPTFSDTWGFVVNEAFACGVPAVVSRAAGACDDLIVDGQTGFAVEPGDARDLADKLVRILSSPTLRLRMAANCRRLIQQYSAEACARGLLAAIHGCQRSEG